MDETHEGDAAGAVVEPGEQRSDRDDQHSKKQELDKTLDERIVEHRRGMGEGEELFYSS
ncbi:MAG TPA: hypothetical protein VK390_12775 [Propionibacteriaceae bacterium]|nr:hypothetical protein [Propionibacteriaceae bacterium]